MSKYEILYGKRFFKFFAEEIRFEYNYELDSEIGTNPTTLFLFNHGLFFKKLKIDDIETIDNIFEGIRIYSKKHYDFEFHCKNCSDVYEKPNRNLKGLIKSSIVIHLKCCKCQREYNLTIGNSVCGIYKGLDYMDYIFQSILSNRSILVYSDNLNFKSKRLLKIRHKDWWVY